MPDLWIREVANHALALMLALNRRLFLLDRYVRSERWIPVIPPPVGPLHGETLGIIGFGRIGRMMAKRGAALDMEMVAYDPFLPAEALQELGVEQVSLDELLRRSDYVSIHSPLTEDTRHLIDAAALKRMKPTAYLINTSRGPVVDEAALATALREGWIAGAGLDVLEQEPPDPASPLLELDNVIITPPLVVLFGRRHQAVAGALWAGGCPGPDRTSPTKPRQSGGAIQASARIVS